MMSVPTGEQPEETGVILDWLKLTEADTPDIDGTGWVLFNPSEESSEDEWIQTDARVDVEEVA